MNAICLITSTISFHLTNLALRAQTLSCERLTVASQTLINGAPQTFSNLSMKTGAIKQMSYSCIYPSEGHRFET
jgi:hypothetical protein